MSGFAGLTAFPSSLLAQSRRPDFKYLDQTLEQRVKAGYFPGMGVQIGAGERILHEAYFGDGGAHQVLHVASAGKWVAAATIATVVDAGKLAWTDPARRYIPQLAGPKGEATLAQLMSHTSGYPDYQPADARRDDYQTLRESVEHIVPLSPVAPPGELFQYGGLSMQVAGRMAEIALGQSFNDIFKTKIAALLDMPSSGFSPVSNEPGFSPMLGGAFFTKVSDYGRFLAMIAQNGSFRQRRVLSNAALKVLEADWTSKARLPQESYVNAARASLRHDIYGLGQWREEVDRTGRATLLSSPGWAGTYGWVDRQRGIWGIVLAKAQGEAAKRDGYSTFLGSSLYVPMVRSAIAESRDKEVKRGAARVRGGELYYEVKGAGVPLIFIHGHGLDRRMWDIQFEHFSRRYRVVRYDLRGYGRSSLPEGSGAFLHADDLRALMDDLKIERAHIVGLSLGGFVVTDFLALYSERVLSAVLAGGDLFDVPGPDTPWTDDQIRQRKRDIEAVKALGLWRYKRQWFETLLARAGSHRDRLSEPLWRMIDEWQLWQPLHIEPRMLLGRSVRKYLLARKPKSPVLILRGDREKAGFAITELVKAQITILTDCGHLSNMERPAAFNAKVSAFFNKE